MTAWKSLGGKQLMWVVARSTSRTVQRVWCRAMAIDEPPMSAPATRTRRFASETQSNSA